MTISPSSLSKEPLDNIANRWLFARVRGSCNYKVQKFVLVEQRTKSKGIFAAVYTEAISQVLRQL